MNPAATTFTVDLAAIAANYKTLQSTCAKAHVGAVLKADAYGTGMLRVAPLLDQLGCRHFFVFDTDEGIALRRIVSGDIYVFAGPHSGDAATFKEHALRPALNSLEDIALWRGTGLPCALHFDTGMNRTGVDAHETAKIQAEPDLLLGLDVRLVMSHFACADDTLHPLTPLQCERFHMLHTALGPLLPAAQWSLCNSAGIFTAQACHYDVTRPGYALYGGTPVTGHKSPMTPAVSIDAGVLQIRTAPRGGTVGYGATYLLDEDLETATLHIGYADGFARNFSNRGKVFWEGHACPVLGRVSMDLITVGIGHLKGRKPRSGDRMEIVGPHQTIDALADQAGMIGYEILTSLGSHADRNYKEITA